MRKKTIILLLAAAVLFMMSPMEPSYAASAGKLSFTNVSAVRNMARGTSLKVKYRISKKYRKYKLRWTSSNKKVLKVDSRGRIRALKNGTATVTARSSRNSKVRDKVRIKVGPAVTAVSVSGKRLVGRGYTVTLTASVSPSRAAVKTLRWKSSDSAVATVDSSGKVTGRSDGTATITAAATDGSGKKASVTIQVFSLSSGDVHFIAHRGYSTVAPENTETAFMMAGRAGFWGAECDVWETAHDTDGSYDLVIQHDDNYLRMCGVDAPVKSLTAAQARALKIHDATGDEKVCFFSTYLKVCSEFGMVPVVEIKDPSMSSEAIEKMVDMIAESGMLSRVHVISFNSDELAYAVKYASNIYGTKITSCYNIGLRDKNDVMTQLQTASQLGFNSVDISYKLLDQQVSDYCHDNGMTIGIWTFDETNMDKLYQLIHMYNVESATMNSRLFS